MFMKRLLLPLLFIPIIFSPLFADNLPESKQATILEASSSAEIYMEATGFYYSEKKLFKKSDVKKNGISNAIIDAKKAAVHYLLLGGSDPILSTDKEVNHFNHIKDEFFRDKNIEQFISYEDAKPRKTVLLNKGTGVKVILDIKVNKAQLIKFLEDEGVIIKQDTLLDYVGNPFIMVLPQLKQNETVSDALSNSKNNSHAAGVIQSYLTAKQYDVVIPNQQEFMNQLNQDQLSLIGKNDDTSYQLALSVGSDVYIQYDITFTDASFGTKQAAVSIKAFETTTARLLGAETGYSEAREGESFVSIEEAILDAMTNVMNRVHNYWESDLEKGVQYKIIASISKSITDLDALEDISDDYFDTLDEIAETVKENTTGSHTIDTTIWVDPKGYKNSRALYRALRDNFNKNSNFDLNKDHQNRKLLLLSLTEK